MGRDASDLEQAITSFRSRPEPLLLDCGVEHYAWGDTAFIPELLGIDNPEGRPYAELWMGAHPSQPSRALVRGTAVSLKELIEGAAEEALGPSVARRFGGHLPFLLKVVSAAAPLSIQVHPDAKRAEEGFARENAARIPLSASNRNYKDPQHKPELLVALADFYGLRGFRPLSEIAETLARLPELREWAGPVPRDARGLRLLYARFMRLPQAHVDVLLEPLVRRLQRENETKAFARADREYWLLRADHAFSSGGHRDRGLLSFYLLNFVHLVPGEAIYLPAGVLHAYLEGVAVEIMANSDNVLRGGLTGKHVDVAELLASVHFAGGGVEILRPRRFAGGREWSYPTPAREFELRRIEVTAAQPFVTPARHGPEILIGVQWREEQVAAMTWPTGSLELRKGRACFVPYGVPYSIRGPVAATFYKATVPLD